VIFQSANEINQNILIKQRTAELQAQTESEKVWWENKRAGIQSSFMKELEEGSEAPAEKRPETRSSDEDAVIVESGGPSAQSQGGKKKGKK
jgi:translocation protein SEC66